MALPVLPNSSNFLGVALVINRNRDGPRFVFHYPPHIVPVADRLNEDIDDGADEDENLLEKDAGPTDGVTPYNLNVSDLMSWDQDEHIITDSGTQIVPWEHVAGFPTKDLESILTPARAYHKSLFQISLDPLYFVSYPIHQPANGIWKKKSKKKHEEAKQERVDISNDQLSPNDEGDLATGQDGTSHLASEADEVQAKMTADKVVSEAKPAAQDETEDKISNMTMFNLVFILNPKKHEAKDLIDTMYINIIRKVNKAYKYVQQRSDFVWKESKRILLLKDKAREEKMKMSVLWEQILQNSSLALSMQDLYEAISRNKIAALQLETGEGTITHSVQIPIPFHIADLPPPDREEDSRGLWITTANLFNSDNDAVEESHYLDKNFALLLMDDDKKIISELNSDPDETTPFMVEFVRHSKPTMSFHQVAQQTTNPLALGQVRKYAQHFIFWRRAIAIPPLHARDVYILSPNANFATLPRAASVWARQFPFAPILPNFLSELSAAPKPYKWFCPSKSFRPNYLAMLAWLMRGGWVTQLCTFAYVVVWPEILYEVDYALEAAAVARAKQAQAMAVDDLAHGAPERDVSALSKERKRRGSNVSENMSASTGTLQRSTASLTGGGGGSGAGTMDRSISDLSAVSITEPYYDGDEQPLPSAPNSPPLSLLREPVVFFSSSSSSNNNTINNNDDFPQSPSAQLSPTASRPPSQPTLAEQVAEKARLERIADKAARELAEKATAHARKAVPTATAHPSANAAPHLAGMDPYIILDAKKATGKESLYLSAIQKRLRTPPVVVVPATGTGSGTAAAPATSRAGGTSSKKTPAGSGVKVKGAEMEQQIGSKEWAERVAGCWPVFWKYFNGRCALERIALLEEMKRKEVWNLLTGMSEYLLCVRHW
ncbi:unnamed protein product [Discula destructiva]